MWAMLAIAAVQAGIGVAQAVKANKDKKALNKETPQYEISEEANQNVRMAEQNMNYDMPGYNKMIESIDRNQANAVNQAGKYATNPNQATEVAVQTQINADRAMDNLSTRSAQWRNEQFGNLQQALGAMGLEKEKQFNYNQMTPWQMNYQATNQMQAAAGQNMFQGFANGMGVYNQQQNSLDADARLDKIINGKG